MGPAEAPARLRVELAYSPAPGQVDVHRVELAAPCSALQALCDSGFLARHGLTEASIVGPEARLAVAVWGKVRPPQTLLRDRDRVELLRALRVDPKEARRQRYRRQKPGGTGSLSGTPKR